MTTGMILVQRSTKIYIFFIFWYFRNLSINWWQLGTRVKMGGVTRLADSMFDRCVKYRYPFRHVTDIFSIILAIVTLFCYYRHITKKADCKYHCVAPSRPSLFELLTKLNTFDFSLVTLYCCQTMGTVQYFLI